MQEKIDLNDEQDKKTNKTAIRLLHTLAHIPRFPSKVSSRDLIEKLEEDGFSISMRDIQRDLNMLCNSYALVCDKRSKPYGWSWAKDAQILSIPNMTTHSALTFHLAEQHLGAILPKDTVKQLQAHFDKANDMLNRMVHANGVEAWRDKVRVLRQGPGLSVPDIHESVQEEVYQGLFLNRRVEISYRTPYNQTKTYTISPLGLVVKNGIFYVVCTAKDYDKVILLALHRILSATKLDIPITPPQGFHLDSYIASGELNFGGGDEIQLKMLVCEYIANHLKEQQLHPNQTISDVEGEKHFIFEASVLNSPELTWWITGFGDAIEVLEPASLRKYFRKQAKRSLANYKKKR